MKTGEAENIWFYFFKEIAAAVKEQLGYDIDKKKIQMKEPVKSLGMHFDPGTASHKGDGRAESLCAGSIGFAKQE